MSPQPVTAQHVFTNWGSIRSVMKRGRLSERSIAKYSPIWDIWLRYLADQQKEWHAATPEDVRNFLLKVQPRRKSTEVTDPRVSPVTQARYWRLLESIYGHAAGMGWITESPVTQEAQVSRNELHESLVFNRIDWEMLLRRMPSPHAPLTDWSAARDRALLLLMAECGLTSGELLEIRLEDLSIAPEPSPAPSATESAPPGGEPALRLQLSVRGPRASQRRILDLPQRAALALMSYRAMRLKLPQDNPFLFVRKRGSELESAYKSYRMTAKSLYVMTAAFIRDVMGEKYPDLVHAGPMALRNSCLVRWMEDGMPEELVLRQAGMKDPQALYRLKRHVVPVQASQGQKGG
jgi:integrase